MQTNGEEFSRQMKHGIGDCDMKLTAFCVLLVFSCLMTNVKVFNKIAKSFQDAGAKVSEALSNDNIQKAFNSIMQSPPNTGNKST
uniref:Uncharacterized protein n=1 Tax=Glossina palpalis gambiensis TaxID=67801 RepID=A0A1B0BQC6_9MUSC